MGSGIGEVAGGIKSIMGQRDPNATNDVLNGQTVATGTPGAQTQADPNQGLTGGQMFARQALSGGLGALGKGLQKNYQRRGGIIPGQSGTGPGQRMGMSFGAGRQSFYGQ